MSGRSALVRAIRMRLRPTDTSVNYIEQKAPVGLASNISLTWLSALPTATSSLTIDASGNIGTQGLGGGGSVTSVGLSAPSPFSVSNSPVTASGTLTFAFASQAANTVLAAPNGAAGTPTMRSLLYADVSGFVGAAANTVAAGNDSRFHTQNTDTGTTQASFQLNSASTGARLKDSSGAVQLRNAGDTAFADLAAGNTTVNGNLTVTGTTFTVNSETMTVDDNIIVLNNNISTGTPTEDGGIQVRRGGSTSSSLIWDETNDFWKAGLAGTEVRVARFATVTFLDTNLTAGIYTFTHSLDNQWVTIQVLDNNNKQILPDEITRSSATQATIDLTTFGTLSGSWRAIAVG